MSIPAEHSSQHSGLRDHAGLSDRIGHAVALSDLTSTDDLDAQCQRITGKTLDQWKALFLRRRRTGIANGHFTSDRLLGEHEMNDMVRYYGLSAEDDFVTGTVRIEDYIRWHTSYVPKVCPISGKQEAFRIVWRLNPAKHPC